MTKIINNNSKQTPLVNMADNLNEHNVSSLLDIDQLSCIQNSSAKFCNLEVQKHTRYCQEKIKKTIGRTTGALIIFQGNTVSKCNF